MFPSILCCSKNKLLLSVGFLLFITFGVFSFFNTSMFVDEYHHITQIKLFLDGRFEQLPTLTMLPTYHLVLAGISYVFGMTNLWFVRLASLVISLSGFYLVYKFLPKNDAKVLHFFQLLFLPVLSLYFFLVYTDIVSLTITLLAFLLTFKQKYFWSAVFFALSVLLRQSNIIWAFMAAVYIYLDNYNLQINLKNIWNYFKKVWGLVIVALGFVVFVKINGGIAAGDKEAHQVGFYIQNIYVFLTLLPILFLPFIITNLKKFFDKLKSINPLLILLLFIVNLLIIHYLYQINHPYNNTIFFIHNFVALMFTWSGWLGHISLSIASLFGVLVLSLIKFPNSKYLLIYPATFLSLAVNSMVDTRYYLTSLAFIIIFREPFEEKSDEWLLLAYYILLSILIIYGVLQNVYFL